MTLRRLTILLVVLTIGVTLLTVRAYLHSRRNISAAVIRQVTETAATQFQAFFAPIGQQVHITRRWVQSGVLDPRQPESINAKFIPILEQHAQIYSLILATGERVDYGLIRKNGAWHMRTAANRNGETVTVNWRSIDKDGKIVSSWKEKNPNSPEITPFYQNAVYVDRGNIFWTQPYAMYPDSKPGMTAVIAWREANQRHLVAISILQTEVDRLMQQISISSSFRCFLFSDGMALIDFTADRPPATAGSFQPAIRNSDSPSFDPIIMQALEVRAGRSNTIEPFRFEFEGVRWWGLLQPVEQSRQADGFGILIPETDLLSQQKGERHIFVIVALAIFWIGFIVYIRTHKQAPDPETGYMDPAKASESDILNLIQSGEDDRLEFKSSLRWNLKTDKAGKEIELACLKTVAAFMNSDGGMLLVGVDDEGRVRGVEADQFESDDKYLQHFSNLFNQHIGLEYTEYVTYSLRPVKNQKIFFIACRPSGQPVFVRHRKDEHFFIRSGPSSRQLTTSQVLEYLKDKP